MSDSPWSDPDEAGRNVSPEDGIDPPEVPRPLGPPSTSLPNIPDITPVAGIPLPDADGSVPEGTAVMPVLPSASPTPPVSPTVVSPVVASFTPASAAAPPSAAASGGDSPRYVVAESVPWHRTPDGRARAGIALGLATLLLVGGIVWLATSGGDEGDVLLTDETTTTLPGQFDASLDASTTTELSPVTLESTTTVIVDTTPEPTTSVVPTTTTTTLPSTTTTAATTSTTTTTSTSTTTTSTSTTTTTTVPPLPVVVVPNAASTIGEIVQASPGLTELDALMSSVGFYAELNAITDPFTLIAPSNAAIVAVKDDLPADPESIRQLLRRHVTTDGRLGSREIFERTELTMLDGSVVVVDGAAQTVGGAKVVVADKGGADADQIVQVVSGIVTA